MQKSEGIKCLTLKLIKRVPWITFLPIYFFFFFLFVFFLFPISVPVILPIYLFFNQVRAWFIKIGFIKICLSKTVCLHAYMFRVSVSVHPCELANFQDAEI